VNTAWPWIVLAAVVVGLVVLAVVAFGTVGRLRPLRLAAREAQIQLDPARLQAKVADLQHELTLVQQRSLVTQERLALVKEHVAAVRSDPGAGTS